MRDTQQLIYGYDLIDGSKAKQSCLVMPTEFCPFARTQDEVGTTDSAVRMPVRFFVHPEICLCSFSGKLYSLLNGARAGRGVNTICTSSLSVGWFIVAKSTVLNSC
jgi:hypothetical protein